MVTAHGKISEDRTCEWTARKLGDIICQYSERAKNGNYEVLSCSKVHGIILQKFKFKNRVASKDTARYKIVKPGMFVYDPMLLWSGSIGKNHYKFIGIVSPAYFVFQTKDMVDSNYLEYLLRSPMMIPKYVMISEGTNVRRRKAKFNDFCNIDILLPPLNEQKNIATILSTAQNTIEKTEVALDALRELKKSMMDYLFMHGPSPLMEVNETQTKETIIGEIPVSWSTVTLGDYSKMDYGTSMKCSLGVSGIPVLRIPNIVRGGVSDDELVSLELTKVQPNKFLEEGDLLFVRTNATRENIGKTMVYKNQFRKASFASYLIRVKIEKDKFNPDFVHYFSQTNGGIRQLSGKASAAADGKFNINTQVLRSVILPRPSIEVQNLIVKYLESIEERILYERRYLDSVEDLFKTLLDSLMVGKIRVNNLELPT